MKFFNKMLTKHHYAILCILMLVLCALFCTCSNQQQSQESPTIFDLDDIKDRDTLRVVTMYGPTSYFNYKDNEMGYEYEMAKLLCSDMGVNMKLMIVNNESELVDAISNGNGDLIAYKLPYTAAYKETLSYTNKEYITKQVIVQCKSDSMIRDVLDLCGKDVYVKSGSIYDIRLQNLNNEVGGGITIKHLPDTVTSEDLIAEVAMHTIPMTVTTADIAKLSKTYFGNIDYTVGISFPQRAAWAVNKNAPDLLNFINKWYADKTHKLKFAQLYGKYFEKSKYFESSGIQKITVHRGLSPYDDIFKTYAEIIDWDWRLLAAVAYKESKFNTDAVSWAGACGLMQLMPATAKSLGVEDERDMFDPDTSIKAGAMYIRKLEKLFFTVEDKEERIKFTIAAYNSGPGHIFDARALAREYGKDPDIWYGNVEHFMLRKADPEIYTDTLCHFGYCRGEETVNYVNDVISKWEQYKERTAQ